MPNVITLEGFTPGQRFDDIPWNRARLEGPSASPTPDWGPLAIETQVLDPLDTDPERPQIRNFTTALSPDPEGWFRVVFLDENDAEQPSAPVYFPGSPQVSLRELKTYLNSSRESNDQLLTMMLSAAVGFARTTTRRQLDPLPLDAGTDPFVHRRRVAGSRFIRVPDGRDITEVKVDGALITDFELWRHPNPISSPVIAVEIPSTSADTGALGDIAEISGFFGFDPWPDDLKDAIYTHVSRNFHERAALYADATSDEFGARTFLRQLPPRVKDVYAYYTVIDRIPVA